MSSKRILAVIAAVLAVVALVVLDTIRLATADIDVTATTNVVHLRIADEDAQLPPVSAAVVQVIGDGSIEDLPGVAAFKGGIEFRAAGATGTLSLSRLVLPAKSGVSLRRLEGLERGYEFTIEPAAEGEIGLDLIAQNELAVVTGETSSNLPAASPLSFHVVVKGRSATIRFALKEPAWSLAQPFAIVGLDLIDVLATGKTAMFSGILEGSVHFPASQTLTGGPSEMVLRRGQQLTFGALENAALAFLTLDGRSIELGMTGTTHGLATRWRSGVRNHMPTALSWLASFDWLRAVAALFLAIVGGGLLSGGAARGPGKQHGQHREVGRDHGRDPGREAAAEAAHMASSHPAYAMQQPTLQPQYAHQPPIPAPPLPPSGRRT